MNRTSVYAHVARGSQEPRSGTCADGAANPLTLEAPQRRNRSHLNPRWDSDFASVGSPTEVLGNLSDQLIERENPHGPNTLATQRRNRDGTVIPDAHPNDNTRNQPVSRVSNQRPPNSQQTDTSSSNDSDTSEESSGPSGPSAQNLADWLIQPTYQKKVPRSGATTDTAAIQRFNKNASKLHQALTYEKFIEPKSSIKLFNSEFPLGRIFNRIKDGIRIFLSTKSSRNNRKSSSSPLMTKIIKSMLDANIICETKNGPFISPVFLVTKANGNARPIIDLHHQVKHIKTPKMVLPSIFQLIQRKKWLTNLYYVKIDFKSAFFNIEVHPNSTHLFTFYYEGKFYCFKRLPFGSSISPFFMQKFLNCIIKFIKQFTEFTWGHIDDIIIAHQDPQWLLHITTLLVSKLNKIKWTINMDKSILKPAKQVIFLGAHWTQTGIKRSKQISQNLHDIITALGKVKHLRPKAIQRIRGVLNYYVGFAGNYFNLVNKFIMSINRKHKLILMHNIFNTDEIKFKTQQHTQLPIQHIAIASDATTSQLAAVTVGNTTKEFGYREVIKQRNGNILENELAAALLGMGLAAPLRKPQHQHKLHLLIDNKAVISFINKGRAKWSWSFHRQAKFLMYLNKLKLFYDIVIASFIPTADNPADAPSRRKHIYPLGEGR